MNDNKGTDHTRMELSPVLDDLQYVFLGFSGQEVPEQLMPIATFMEREGTTLIIPRFKADEHRYSYDSVMSHITIGLLTSLTEVGVTAVISQALAAENIPCNMFAGYYRDHVFVPVDRSREAMDII